MPKLRLLVEFKGWREHGETRNEEKKKTNKNKKMKNKKNTHNIVDKGERS